MCTHSTENISNNKEAKNVRSREIFSKIFSFYRLYIEQQIPRLVDKNRRKMYYLGRKKRHTVKNQLTVNNRGFIIHKANHHKKGRRHDYIFNI
jgi:catabolite regulation protein CreA